MKESVLNLLQDKYFLKDESNWEQLAHRVSSALATSREEGDNFYTILSGMDFVPNSPMLMNAGTEIGYYSACLVLPVEDSMEGIFKTLYDTALVQKAGAGTGFSFSRLRPKGDIVGSTRGVSSGVISFMQVFNKATREIKQGGRRRGANMGLLRVDHPEIIDFITCKGTLNDENQKLYEASGKSIKVKQHLLENQLSMFNISIGLTDKFMQAVKEGEKYDIIHPRDGSVVTQYDAQEVFDLIAEYAHKNGEPGIVFLDEINRRHPIDEEIEGVNVCGEQPLLPYEQCVLGALNLPKFLKSGVIDYDKLDYTIEVAVRLLDNAIDLNNYPTEDIKEKALDYRKIGLGVMGFGELLIRMGVRYGSPESLRQAEHFAEYINRKAIETSQTLAKEKEPFRKFDNTDITIPRRNAVVTTVAPTGSRAIIADTTSGIEPLYSVEKYTHEDGEGTLRSFNFDFMKDADPDCLVDAHSISYEDHVRMQASWQEHIGSSISKTVNLPENATVSDVKNAFKMAYKLGCKGLTVYRNKSRQKQVLTVSNNNKSDRPTITQGITEKTKIGCGKLYITINADENKIMEVFTTTGKGGGCHAQSEAISRLVSLGLRKGVEKDDIIDQLKGIRCEAALVKKDVHNLSCPDAIGRALEKTQFSREGSGVMMKSDLQTKPQMREECPVCGSSLERESGCETCRNCGWSACG